jgi:cytoskeleton protein RodZ
MSDIGERLRRARNDVGLSLPQVAARTRIQVRILDAIERNEYARLPPGVFLRGFLHAFAREVGLDPEAIVAEYVTSQEPPPVARRAPATPIAVDDAADTPGFTSHVWGSMVLATSALAAVLWLDAQQSGTGDSAVSAPAAIAVDELAVTSMMEDATPAVIEQAASAPAAVLVSDSSTLLKDAPASGSEAAVRERLDVHIQATGLLWLEATTDGHRSIYRLLHAGDEAHLVATSEIRLRVGDVSALRYSIGGAPGRSLGGPGQVRDVRITHQNHRTFTQPPGGGETD